MKNTRTPMDYFELVETFPKPGCALCNLLRRDADRAIDGLVFGFMDTDELRAVFRATRGLCSEHGWQIKQNKFGNVLGIAKLYAAALDEVVSLLETTPAQVTPQAQSKLERLLNGERRSAAPLAEQLEPAGRCLICERLDEREVDYCRMFDQYLLEERFRSTLEQSDGLCLPHVRSVLRYLTDPARVEVFVQTHVTIWKTLHAEVAAFANKQNYEHIHELTEGEGDSWVRAIAALSGDRSLFGVQRR